MASKPRDIVLFDRYMNKWPNKSDWKTIGETAGDAVVRDVTFIISDWESHPRIFERIDSVNAMKRIGLSTIVTSIGSNNDRMSNWLISRFKKFDSVKLIDSKVSRNEGVIKWKDGGITCVTFAMSWSAVTAIAFCDRLLRENISEISTVDIRIMGLIDMRFTECGGRPVMVEPIGGLTNLYPRFGTWRSNNWLIDCVEVMEKFVSVASTGIICIHHSSEKDSIVDVTDVVERISMILSMNRELVIEFHPAITPMISSCKDLHVKVPPIFVRDSVSWYKTSIMAWNMTRIGLKQSVMVLDGTFKIIPQNDDDICAIMDVGGDSEIPVTWFEHIGPQNVLVQVRGRELLAGPKYFGIPDKRYGAVIMYANASIRVSDVIGIFDTSRLIVENGARILRRDLANEMYYHPEIKVIRANVDFGSYKNIAAYQHDVGDPLEVFDWRWKCAAMGFTQDLVSKDSYLHFLGVTLYDVMEMLAPFPEILLAAPLHV